MKKGNKDRRATNLLTKTSDFYSFERLAAKVQSLSAQRPDSRCNDSSIKLPLQMLLMKIYTVLNFVNSKPCSLCHV